MQILPCNAFKNLDSSYLGTVNITASGRTCQKWNSQIPHIHSRTPSNRNFYGTGLGDHNFCRNPDNAPKGAWCYTTDSDIRWEYCGCHLTDHILPTTECRNNVEGITETIYRGTLNVSRSGIPCQKWTRQTPHNHGNRPSDRAGAGLGDHNYCRNPDNEPNGAWCYTTDIDVRWEYCSCSGNNIYFLTF